ncbi:MAG: CopG family transcriptional regulator [Leptospiraceae bacterium]|nr:CopG family transcriptional regulator [Leptospiraceae bacterium]
MDRANLKTITMKITEAMAEDIQTLTKDLDISQSAFVRDAIIDYMTKIHSENNSSFAEKTKKYRGIVSLAPDLSTNKQHLVGFGR